MLQQTQVSTVIPYYHRFLKAFPTLSHLAQASEGEVLSLWAGLGYYSRARNLQKGAQFIVQNHQGQVPTNRESLLKVPGIGPYTAGALLSIAFHQNEPLVDGNVERVFSRYFGFQKPLGSTEAKRFFWKKATELVQTTTDPASLNQALMELGSLVCTKSSPRCGHCPLQSSCTAFQKNLTETLPIPKKRPKKLHLQFIKLVIEKEGRFFTQQNSAEEWWAGLWDFPSIRIQKINRWMDEIKESLDQYSPHFLKELTHQKHTVTHHQLEVVPVHIQVRKKPRIPGQWVTLRELKKLPKSALVTKIIAQHF